MSFITKYEQNNCNKRVELCKSLVFAGSWQALYIMLTLHQASCKITWLDWLVVLATYVIYLQYINANFWQDVEPEIIDIRTITDAIDQSDFLDDVVKHTKILKFLLYTSYSSSVLSAAQRRTARLIVAHVFHKFPQLAKHSANIVTTKYHRKHQRVTLEEAEKIYLADKSQ